MIKPTGFHVLVEMGVVEQTTASGIIMRTKEQQAKEEGGHYLGTVVAIGPTAHVGYDGITADTPEGRAKEWGYAVGDTVYIGRYAGNDTLNEIPGFEKYRMIVDSNIMGALGD